MSRLLQRGCAIVGAAAAFLVGPAAAEPAVRLAQIYPAYPVYPAPPPQPDFRRHHVDAAVRSLGLTPIGPAQRHGPVFIVPAVGREGTRVQVTLDRHSGRVLQISRLGPAAPHIARQPVPAPGYEADDDDDYAALDDDELPPQPHMAPGYRGPNVISRDPDITNSIPRSSPRSVDPLMGVPKEFRGSQPAAREERQHLAARPPADAVPPLPRPRPADAPSVAQRETPPPAAVASQPKPDPKDVPDVQGFE